MGSLEGIAYFFEVGGLVMWAIALLAFFSYFFAFYTLYWLAFYNKICRKNVEFFRQYKLAFNDTLLPEEIKGNFEELRAKIFDRVDGRLRYALALSAVAPLLGLLGTISGLGLSLGGILNSTSDVSQGIAKALYTTQAGLSVALPVFIIVLIARSFKQKILINISKHEISLLRGLE